MYYIQFSIKKLSKFSDGHLPKTCLQGTMQARKRQLLVTSEWINSRSSQKAVCSSYGPSSPDASGSDRGSIHLAKPTSSTNLFGSLLRGYIISRTKHLLSRGNSADRPVTSGCLDRDFKYTFNCIAINSRHSMVQETLGKSDRNGPSLIELSSMSADEESA